MGAELIHSRLEAAVLDAIDKACAGPLRWGKDDCALWCASALECVLGYDAAADFRGKYRTRRGAKRKMGKGGLAATLRKIARRHGWQAIDPLAAQAGDIGLVEVDYRGERALACVICRARGWFVGRKDYGVTIVPAKFVRLCFKVAPHVRSKPFEYGHGVALPSLPHRSRLIATSAAMREPVSTVIGLTALIASTFSVSTAVAGAIGGAIIGAGISVGLSYAASALQQRGNQPLSNQNFVSPNDPSIRYNTRQPIPPKRIIYGTAQVGGALFFEETINPHLYQGLMICAKPITRFRKLWIGTNELSFTNLSENGILIPLSVAGQPSYSTRLQASLRLGASDQSMDAILARDFPALSGTAIAGGTGTPTGDMTGASGLAAAFDDGTDETTAQSAQKTVSGSGTATVGKDWGSSTLITGFQMYAPNNSLHGFSNDSNGEYKFTLQGSVIGDYSDAVTIAVSDYTQYGPSAIASAADPTYATSFPFHRVLMEERLGDASPHNLWCAECIFFTSSGSPEQFRQQGIATAVLRYDFGADQAEYTNLWGQQQRPNPIFLVDGIAVPDPRKASHIIDFDPNDPTEVAAAEATWEFSNNAALCQTHFLIQQYGGRIDPRRIDWDKVKQAADWDDGMVGTTEGDFIRRGTIDGLITLNQRPSDVMSSMLSANRGFVLESAGRVWVSSSEPRTSVATIHDAILSGGIEYQAAKPKRDLINQLKVRFVAEDREYQNVDGPILTRDDLVDSDQELLAAVLELPFTLDNRRAQVLQKAFLETARLGRRLNCTVDIELLAIAADELVGNAVTFSSDLFPKFNGTYFVEKWGFAEQFGSVNLSLVEYEASIETDFDPATDQQPFTITDI